jgi:hypothetical protein
MSGAFARSKLEVLIQQQTSQAHIARWQWLWVA